jgi:hypothetical protein
MREGMSFLDNLENNLKSLESREEVDPAEFQRREDKRALAKAIAPWAAKLKAAPFTQALFEHATVAGHRLRTKVYMSWFDDVLALQARERKLELRPTPDGIVAAFIEADRSETIQPLDLSGDPASLITQWLG